MEAVVAGTGEGAWCRGESRRLGGRYINLACEASEAAKVLEMGDAKRVGGWGSGSSFMPEPKADGS
jgi:hypothetical protein